MIDASKATDQLRDSVAFKAGEHFEQERIYNVIRNRLNLFRSIQPVERSYSKAAHNAVITELELLLRVIDGGP